MMKECRRENGECNIITLKFEGDEMKITKDNLYCSICSPAYEKIVLTKPLEYNVEYPLFCFPQVVKGKWRSVVERAKKRFQAQGVKTHIHGPYMELMYHSQDADVQKLAQKKFTIGLQIARELNAQHMVVHSTYNPLNPDPKHTRVWLEQSVRFWKKMVPVARRYKCMIVIENVYDTSPDLLKELVNKVNSPFFKICMDIGHVNIFSRHSLEEWISILKPDLHHIHIHDNDGTEDGHLALGEGKINLKKFFAALSKLRYVPACVLEMKDEAALKKSIKYLKDNGILENA